MTTCRTAIDAGATAADSLVNMTEGITMLRSSINGNAQNLAISLQGTDVPTMKKMVYKQIGEITDEFGKTTPIFRWIKHDAIDNNNSIWDPLS